MSPEISPSVMVGTTYSVFLKGRGADSAESHFGRLLTKFCCTWKGTDFDCAD